MARKLVIMKGGNGKPASLPASLADGLVKMRRATYYEDPAAKAKAEAKEQAKAKAAAKRAEAKAQPKAPTYATRAMTAAKPEAKKTWPSFAKPAKTEDKA